MATVLTDDTHYNDIATAIRAKLGVATKYLPSEMADAIELIDTSGGGTELTSEDEGKVVVESDGEYVLQAQTSLSVSSNGTYDTTLNNEVVVAVSGGGGGTSGKLYVESQDGTISMSLWVDGEDVLQTIYFNGFTKSANDVDLPSPLDNFAPKAILITKAYDSANGEWIGNIGFNTNGRARSWTKDNRNTLAGTFWGTLYLVNGALDTDKPSFVASGGTVLDVPYEAPA